MPRRRNTHFDSTPPSTFVPLLTRELVEKMRGDLKRHKVGVTGNLSRSISARALRITDTTGNVVIISLRYGMFVDLGSGRGMRSKKYWAERDYVTLRKRWVKGKIVREVAFQGIGSKLHKRERKPFYAKNIHWLHRRMAERYMEYYMKARMKDVLDYIPNILEMPF